MTEPNRTPPIASEPELSATALLNNDSKPDKLTEVNGPKGLEPTRYGDWERSGRCVDF